MRAFPACMVMRAIGSKLAVAFGLGYHLINS